MSFSGQSAFAASSWVPLPGEVLIVIAIIMELFGVVALLSGWKMKEGALVLALYTFLTIIMFHVGDGQMMAALKNFAIIGGLLVLSTSRPGKISL
jgi:putative oxidoreductase